MGFSVKAHLVKADFAEPQCIAFLHGEACIFSRPCPGYPENGDVIGLIELGEHHGLFILADGAGGTPRGNDASGLALQTMIEHLQHWEAKGSAFGREAVLSAIDAAHEAISQTLPKAGSTMTVIELNVDDLRAYVIGDSAILISGQRGKRKFQSIAHSPTGLAVEAGFLDEDEALKHPERSLVLNLLGLEDWSIGLSSLFPIDERDTLLMCSDGLTDNLTNSEIIEIIRRGPLREAGLALTEKATDRMLHAGGVYHAPDDLSFILFRKAAVERVRGA